MENKVVRITMEILNNYNFKLKYIAEYIKIIHI